MTSPSFAQQPDISYEMAKSHLEHCERYRIGWGTWFLSVAVFSGLAFLGGVYFGSGLGVCS